ncbi:hypothetical protein U9M48_010417 [Paspalum notatum var. saurae]|uniref:E3 ubiquitin-protein ligase FANCL n=1 Tax=Paspalum notatum var. saurae TaxID=547442 RepID=A0AAQ3ST78_PASNO
MELPATHSRAPAPARPQPRAGEEACADARKDAQAEAGPPPRRPPAFYSSVFAQIEEIGWERLVSATGDDGMSCLTFRVVDEQGRIHLLEITLPMGYAASPPLIAADVPYLPKIRWSKSSRLKDVICQFQEHLKILQEFWSTMDEIDKVLLVVDPAKTTYAMSHRCIALGDDCYILLHVDAHKPSSLPECRFLGTDRKLDRLIMSWRKNRKKWDTKKKFHENLASILDFPLPAPPSASNVENNDQADCGICYATHLPVDDELGAHSGRPTDYTCDNPSCSRAFHSVCLKDWLRSITTTRQSFDVLFGNCPYCSDPVAVKITDR